MSYITDMLQPGERILLKAQTSKIAYLNALFVLAAMMHPFGLMRLARTELALTDKRILGATGAARRATIALPFQQIESVTVRSGLLGWMLDYGNVTVTGKDGRRVTFKGILWPLIFQQEADEAIEMAVLGRKLSDYAPNF
jgi:hypothetical protein